MSHIFHRNPKQALPTAVRGEGLYIIDDTGRRYLDASGGAAVSCLGHAHPRITQAIQRQAEALEYAHTSFFTTAAAEALATWLIERAPAGLDRVYFGSGGSEAGYRPGWRATAPRGGAGAPGGRCRTAPRS